MDGHQSLNSSDLPQQQSHEEGEPCQSANGHAQRKDNLRKVNCKRTQEKKRILYLIDGEVSVLLFHQQLRESDFDLLSCQTLCELTMQSECLIDCIVNDFRCADSLVGHFEHRGEHLRSGYSEVVERRKHRQSHFELTG